jgi:acetyl esterase/lipase
MACSSRGADTTNVSQKPRPAGGSRNITNLYYVPNGTDRQNLDIYLPATGSNFPVVIWVHGGGWTSNSKEHPGGFSFVRDGYALVSINYRQSQHAKWPAQIVDCKSAIRWLRAHAAEYSLDAGHIGVWGLSSGGHMVAMLGVTGDTREFDQGDNLSYSSAVQVVGDWFGPTDFLSVSNEPGHMRWGGNGDVDTSLLGGKPSENIEKAKSASPAHFVSKNSAPFIIMHGAKDLTVPVQQSDELVALLKKAGVPVEYYVVPNGGHGQPKAEFEGPVPLARLHAFFDKYLKPGKAAGAK